MKRFVLKKPDKMFQACVFPYNQGQGSGDRHMQGRFIADSLLAELSITVPRLILSIAASLFFYTFDSHALR